MLNHGIETREKKEISPALSSASLAVFFLMSTVLVPCSLKVGCCCKNVCMYKLVITMGHPVARPYMYVQDWGRL